MLHFRSVNWLPACFALLASGCGSGAPDAPPFVPLAENLADDSRFTFDGVDVTGRRAVAQGGSRHPIGASTCILHPERYPAGVECLLRIVGVNAEGILVTCDAISGPLKLDRDNRVSIKGDLQMARPREYEIQLLIVEGKERFLVGRVPLVVIPVPEPEPEPDVEPSTDTLNEGTN